MKFSSFILQIKQFYKIVIFGLLGNKLRSFLTMLGIIIGVASVIIIMSLGAGAQSLILSEIKNLGGNVIGILPGKAEDSGPPASVMGIVITTLTYDDAMALKNKRNVPNIVDIVAYVKSVASVSWENRNIETNISGTTTGNMTVEGGEVKDGRFFDGNEEKDLSRVAVLGASVKEGLFGDSDAIGKKIKIQKISFEVIGVMEERGTVVFQDFDDQVFIPITTMQKLILGVNHISLIRAKIDSEENMDRAEDDIEKTLRERHSITDSSGNSDDFTVRNMEMALDILSVVTDSLNLFLVAMASISLVVGGIGIMNIMLISVKERTREIGLRKAVGATNRDILVQFLIESIFLTLMGGLFGLFFGVLIAYLIALGINFSGLNWDFIIPISAIILGISVSSIIGLVFGIYPARKASKLSPINALRNE